MRKRRGEYKGCCVCNKLFYVKRSHITERATEFFFCSRLCANNSPQGYRDIISKKRKEYLKNNPDKHVWKRADRFKSVPCESVKGYLKKNNIQFIEEITPSPNRSFSIDIAFPDKMIGLEINGAQHYERTGELKPYYLERHNHIESLGWKIYEIYYSLCFKEEYIIDIVNKILNSENKIDFNYSKYISERIDLARENKEAKLNKKNKYVAPIPPREELALLLESKNQKEIAEHYKVSDQIVMRWRIKYQLKISNTISILRGMFPKVKQNICHCGNIKAFQAKYCKICANMLRRKAERPSREQLHWLVWNYSHLNLSNRFGVSDRAISKWCKSFCLSVPNLGYWSKLNHGHIVDYQI